MSLGAWFLLAAGGLVAYAYAGYPALLWVLSRLRRLAPQPVAPSEWPAISIALAAHNEERSIGATLECLLATDYPPGRRQIVVVSDASTDRTDDIVRSFRDRGVELLRLPQRSGKTAAENAALGWLSGDIVLNTDASVRVHRDAVKSLVMALRDPEVGTASSRDISVARLDDPAGAGEAGYVGYEMWVRRLETRVYGIVGASGSLYATRSTLHQQVVPAALSRDFSAALIAREHGFRAVSVDEAICYVPRGRSLTREYRRKVRTMTRGLETMWHRRHLLNPIRYGVFSWMLISHKLLRWLVPWALVLGAGGVVMVSIDVAWARWVVAAAGVVLGLGAGGWALAEGRVLPRALALPAFLLMGVVAGLEAWVRALRGERNPIWEPTRREAPLGPSGT